MESFVYKTRQENSCLDQTNKIRSETYHMCLVKLRINFLRKIHSSQHEPMVSKTQSRRRWYKIIG